MTEDEKSGFDADLEVAYQAVDRQKTVGMRALAGLFLLEHEFRRVVGHDYLARLLVNRLNRFAPYDCAVFWTKGRFGRFDVTISGIAKSKENKPVLLWGQKLGKWLHKSGWGNKQISAQVIAGNDKLEPWPQNMPRAGLYVPLVNRKGKVQGGIFLLREAGWSQPVRVLFDQLAEAAAYTMEAMDRGVHGGRGWSALLARIGVVLSVFFIIFGSFLIPVPVNVDVPARLAVPIESGLAPRGPAQIDIRLPPQGAMALEAGSRLQIRHDNMDYELEVEHISPWMAGLFADRHVRARLVRAPDGLAPPVLERVTIENAHMPLPLYVLRRPIAMMRQWLNLD